MPDYCVGEPPSRRFRRLALEPPKLGAEPSIALTWTGTRRGARGLAVPGGAASGSAGRCVAPSGHMCAPCLTGSRVYRAGKRHS